MMNKKQIQDGYHMTLYKLIFLGLLISVNQALAITSFPQGIIKLDGTAAPALVLKDMDGAAYDITQSRGKWVFVHFWASWCRPCREEVPAIQDIMVKFKNTHLDIVVINTAESEDTVFSFLGLLAPDINSLMDEDGLATELWQPRGLPSTYFVDPQGKLRYLALGGMPWNQAEYTLFLNQLKQHTFK